MRLENPVLIVADMEKSVAFYQAVFGLDVILDFGANKTLTGGLALQTLDAYQALIGSADISFGGNNFELYFEADKFDAFAEQLRGLEIDFVHPILEQPWGQRVVRFYDPDRHILEVGEKMTAVCQRFLARGMTPEQVAQRMDVPVDYVNQCIAGG